MAQRKGRCLKRAKTGSRRCIKRAKAPRKGSYRRRGKRASTARKSSYRRRGRRTRLATGMARRGSRCTGGFKRVRSIFGGTVRRCRKFSRGRK